MKKTYNLSTIMKKAWTLFNAGVAAFAECLRVAWSEAKDFANKAAQFNEELHTWYSWKTIGMEVIHESKALFQIVVADPKTKSGTRVLSYFGKSQVQEVCNE